MGRVLRAHDANDLHVRYIAPMRGSLRCHLPRGFFRVPAIHLQAAWIGDCTRFVKGFSHW